MLQKWILYEKFDKHSLKELRRCHFQNEVFLFTVSVFLWLSDGDCLWAPAVSYPGGRPAAVWLHPPPPSSRLPHSLKSHWRSTAHQGGIATEEERENILREFTSTMAGVKACFLTDRFSLMMDGWMDVVFQFPSSNLPRNHVLRQSAFTILSVWGLQEGNWLKVKILNLTDECDLITVNQCELSYTN